MIKGRPLILYVVIYSYYKCISYRQNYDTNEEIERIGEWENGRMGEWENGRMGEVSSL